MMWQSHLPSPQRDVPDESREEVVDIGSCRIGLRALNEIGPTVEVNNLFRKLYGHPHECKTFNPYIAEFRRFRARILTYYSGNQNGNGIAGSVDYRYWPSLKLGYIENAYVTAEVRRHGLGVKLISFATNDLRGKGSYRVYAFSTNAEGYGLLDSAGFANEAPDNPARPWHRWFLTSWESPGLQTGQIRL